MFPIFNPIRQLVRRSAISTAPVAIFTALAGGFVTCFTWIKFHLVFDWISDYIPDFSWVEGLLDSEIGNFLGYVFALDFLSSMLVPLFAAIPVVLGSTLIILVDIFSIVIAFLCARVVLKLALKLM